MNTRGTYDRVETNRDATGSDAVVDFTVRLGDTSYQGDCPFNISEPCAHQ